MSPTTDCLAPSRHPDDPIDERADHLKEPPTLSDGLNRQETLEADHQGGQDHGPGLVHVPDQHGPHAQPNGTS